MRMTGMGWVRRRGRKVNGRERKYRGERKGLGKEEGEEYQEHEDMQHMYE